MARLLIYRSATKALLAQRALEAKRDQRVRKALLLLALPPSKNVLSACSSTERAAALARPVPVLSACTVRLAVLRKTVVVPHVRMVLRIHFTLPAGPIANGLANVTSFATVSLAGIAAEVLVPSESTARRAQKIRIANAYPAPTNQQTVSSPALDSQKIQTAVRLLVRRDIGTMASHVWLVIPHRVLSGSIAANALQIQTVSALFAL